MTGPGLRPNVLAAKQQLAEGRARLRALRPRASPGNQVCRAHADLYDTIVLGLWRDALADLALDGADGASSPVALIVHGGCGRRDVAPYSDYDLMILHARGMDRRVQPLASRLLRDVGDTGIHLGMSVRTTEQACSLSMQDPVVFTSLVESRLLAGGEALFCRFQEKLRQATRWRWRKLLAAVEQARNQERAQYGETIYLLEPNVKRSRGGLRDVQLIRWIGYIGHGATDPEGLYLVGALPRRDFEAVSDAVEFLLRIRNELHFHAQKAQDILERAEQVRLAELFGYTGSDGLLPVEQFMRDYFRHTTAVSNIAAWFAQNSRPGSRTARVLEALCSHRVENDFRVGPTQIAATTSGLEKFRRGLEEILRLADLANLYGKRIAHRTCEAIRDSVAELPDTLSRPAAERFLSLMSQPLKLGPLLRTLHELGVLEKIIPAFVHARCLLQFNQYHKFTVDEHCLRAVEIATEFWHDPGPLGRAYRGLKSKRVLHLALLLHDLGKGYPEDHSEVGLRIADETAARLRLPEDEADALRFLVHKHLMLSHLAFRRDTSDERVIIRLAFDVGSPERLTMLYLLTAADLNAVGPGVLNSWKVDVLTSLYDRTMHHLSGDADAARTEDRLRALRQDVWAALGDVDDRPWFEDQVQALPTGYLMAHGPVEVAQELRELHTLPPGALVAQARYQGENNTVQYKVGTHEDITPGVFHKLTGALTGAGLEILSAEIHTLARGLIVDRFVVVDPDYAGEPPPERIEAVLAALHSAVRNPGPPVFRKTWGTRRGSQPIDLAPLPTQVRIDNNTSDEFTIIDVFTTDRTGLLYAITKTLFDLGLSVSLAKIGTFLDQVVDVFYVTDRNGQKIHNPERLDAIREALLREIEVPEPQAAHGTSS